MEYHLPSENKQARMELGVRVGHLFMALLHWLDALESFADDELPDTVLLIQPGLGYRIGTPLFSMWTFKFTKHKPRVITRELRHNVKLESIKTNKPGRLIFFTNVMTSSTGHFLSAYGSKPDWWIINRPDVPDSQKQNNKLSEIKPVIAENSTDNLKIELSSEDKNNNASNETLVFAMLNYLKEKYEELVNKSGMSE
ncbi:hypothetical protein [Endozoicomonas lisbonensis]|uniref:hypothetical protein n=1 Tax=Endozoicomonas lisbonensis TaxID=3120522 RepID=UPI003391BC0C